jgi:hypothetical protein
LPDRRSSWWISSGTVRWTNFTQDVRIRAKADEMLAAASGLK